MRLLSWNVQWARGADGVVAPERLIEHLRRIGPADVICLQEVAARFPGLPGGGQADLPALLQKAFPGYQGCYGPALDVPGERGERATFGNLILSRYAMGQVFRHLLPCPPERGVPSMHRGCLETVLETPFGPIRILTTHLEYYSRRQRLAQIRAIQDVQREVATNQPATPTAETSAAFSPRPRPVSAVLCGDFNCSPGSDEYQMIVEGEIEKPMWRDAWSVSHPGEAHAPTVGLHGAEWPDHAYCCDFMFVTPDLVPRVKCMEVAGWTDASDHQPLLLEMSAGSPA